MGIRMKASRRGEKARAKQQEDAGNAAAKDAALSGVSAEITAANDMAANMLKQGHAHGRHEEDSNGAPHLQPGQAHQGEADNLVQGACAAPRHISLHRRKEKCSMCSFAVITGTR